MAPTQVLGQLQHFALVRPGLSEADHMKEVLPAESRTVVSRQLSRQCRDNRFAILSSFPAENLRPQPCADAPVQKHQFGAQGLRGPLACSLNEATKFPQ